MDPITPPRGSFDRERALAILRRWSPVILVSAILAGIAAFGVSKVLPPEYKATAEMYLIPASGPSITFQDVVLGQNLARSYVQLATAEVVLRPAMDEIRWSGDLRAFQQRLQVSQVRDTSIMTVAFRDGSPERAASAANAIAQSFIAQTRAFQSSLQDSTSSQLVEQVQSVQADIQVLDSQVSGLRQELASTPRPGQTATSRAEIQAQLSQADLSRQQKQTTLAQLLKTRDEMRLAAARSADAVSLWQPASAPDQPEFPRTSLNVALGALSGALIALLVLFAAAYLDDRLHDVEEVHSRLGVAPLAQIHIRERSETLTGKLFVRDSPNSPEAEAFRSLRTNLQFASVDSKPRSLVITSAYPGEGKSVVCANLAWAFAEAGHPTVLIDGDLRRPTQHRLFKVSARVGLTSLLTDSIDLTELRQFEVAPNLLVIPSGPLPPNPAELLASGRMTSLIKQLTDRFANGFVIIDTSPVVAVTDGVALATKVDGTLVVIDSTHTRTASARRAIESLKRVQAVVLGVVLNKVSIRSAPYYYYYGQRDVGTSPTPVGRPHGTARG